MVNQIYELKFAAAGGISSETFEGNDPGGQTETHETT
jgi:hypothetical protein